MAHTECSNITPKEECANRKIRRLLEPPTFGLSRRHRIGLISLDPINLFFPFRVRTHGAVMANSAERLKRVVGVHTGRLANLCCQVTLHIQLLRS
ncbi:hypothetical protein AVEN_175185-1 [Araneus ventricosus]|uniref:Uncharacterized protein n=1 Tax=Araneus ventricosus TaxID=182803 RepID=A0A4Y2HI48_ARAVE|nr:hypothetical protein AVEN_175185-1 [Araneus ventricosus]